jgi:hypothetical protein
MVLDFVAVVQWAVVVFGGGARGGVGGIWIVGRSSKCRNFSYFLWGGAARGSCLLGGWEFDIRLNNLEFRIYRELCS